MVMHFIGNLLGVKANQAVNAGIEALVRWDPQGATEAELRTMEQHLDELGLQVARARQSYDRERKEADAIQALAHQRLAAAESLQNQANGATDAARKADLEKSLTTLLDLMEKMAPEVQREAQDAQDAKAFLEQLEAAYAEAGGKLKTARSQLGRSATWRAQRSGARWPSSRPRRRGGPPGCRRPRAASMSRSGR
ncbi:MAG: hypothetical protein ACM3JG_04510 [Thiohalocapsa sp.]